MRPAQDVKEALLGGNLVPFKSRLVIENGLFRFYWLNVDF